MWSETTVLQHLLHMITHQYLQFFSRIFPAENFLLRNGMNNYWTWILFICLHSWHFTLYDTSLPSDLGGSLGLSNAPINPEMVSNTSNQLIFENLGVISLLVFKSDRCKKQWKFHLHVKPLNWNLSTYQLAHIFSVRCHRLPRISRS